MKLVSISQLPHLPIPLVEATGLETPDVETTRSSSSSIYDTCLPANDGTTFTSTPQPAWFSVKTADDAITPNRKELILPSNPDQDLLNSLIGSRVRGEQHSWSNLRYKGKTNSSIVFTAEDNTGKSVVVKVYRNFDFHDVPCPATMIEEDQRLLQSITGEGLFRNEVAALEKLRNIPNIVHLLDKGVVTANSEKLNFVVLSRGRVMTSDKIQMSGRCLVDSFIQLFSALNRIHEKGIVHGDVKPRNILLTGDAPTLIDFNHSRKAGEKAIFGTRDFAPPQLYHSIVNHRSYEATCNHDNFSMLASMYYFLTGDAPDFNQFGKLKRAEDIRENVLPENRLLFDFLVEKLNTPYTDDSMSNSLVFAYTLFDISHRMITNQLQSNAPDYPAWS